MKQKPLVAGIIGTSLAIFLVAEPALSGTITSGNVVSNTGDQVNGSFSVDKISNQSGLSTGFT